MAFATRSFVVALTLLALYFGMMLIPTWWPAFAASGVFVLYVLSIPVSLVVLAGLGLWGLGGAAAATIRGLSIARRHRVFIVLSLAGALMFGSSLLLARSIRRALPTGSDLLEFAPAVWQDPNSSKFIQGDITPRQKMLGSLVKRLTPAQSRAQLEALLGPSLETFYFQSTGRDLIYILGPQRDSPFGIDSEWLLIWLDASGHFERYGIYVD